MLPSTAQWFEPFSECHGCGKRAAGTLYDFRNSKLGIYCKRYAERAIKQAHRSKQFMPDIVREDPK